MKEMDNFEDYGEEVVSKKNRRQRKEADENRMVVGPRPLVVIPKESRKQRDRRRNLAVKDAMK